MQAGDKQNLAAQIIANPGYELLVEQQRGELPPTVTG